MEAAPPGFMVKRGVRGKGAADIERTPSLSSPTAASVLATAASAGSATAGDTPFGFDRLPPMTASVAAFQRRCEWFYVDPAGEEHGPVPLQKIINWHKKGHFPEDVKVRCRSPWQGVGALIKSLEEAQDVDTPTALARAGGSGSWATDGATPAVLPPPPPPPRQGSIGGAYAAPVPGNYDAELNALFIGSGAWGDEPVWYYIDRSDQLQGPFSAKEMIGWVSTGMLKEDTRMCGAEPKLGIPPARGIFQPLSDLLLIVRRGERYLPTNLDTLRRKNSLMSNAVGVQPPPPPPPPRRADSLGEAFGASAFGPPGRASDAPTWRKDIPPPAPPSNSSATAAPGGGRSSSDSGGNAGNGSARDSDTGAPAAGTAPADANSNAAAKHTADGHAAESDRDTPAAKISDDGNKAASYHNSNAEALKEALAPDQDFDYGDDFKHQRQVQREAAQAAAAVGQSQGRGPPGTTRMPPGMPIGRAQSDQLAAAAAAAGLSNSASGNSASAGLQVPGQPAAGITPQQLQLMQQAGGITPELLQQLIQQQQQAAQQKAQQAVLGMVPGMIPVGMQGMGLAGGAAGNASAVGPGGVQGVPASVAAGIMNLSLQQQPQGRQQQMVTGQMPMLVSMPMGAAQQQPQQQGHHHQQQGAQPTSMAALPAGVQLQQVIQPHQQQALLAYLHQQAQAQQQQQQTAGAAQPGAAGGAAPGLSASQQLAVMQQTLQVQAQQQSAQQQQQQQLQQLQAALQSGRLVAVPSVTQAAANMPSAAAGANAGMLVGQGPPGVIAVPAGQQQQQQVQRQ